MSLYSDPNVLSGGQASVLAALMRGSVEDVCLYMCSSSAVADSFRAYLAHNQLLGYTAYLLHDHPLHSDLPAPFQADLELHSKKLGWKYQKVRTLLPLLADSFDRAGIPFIVLKGLNLALRFYGGVERRTFWDMDILVNPAHLASANRLLNKLGYERASHLFISEPISRYFTHAFDFRKQGSIDIDLHWKLVNHPGLQFDYQEIWRSRQALELEGTHFSVLSDEYALSFLLIGIVKDIERGSLRIRSMVDLYILLRAMDGAMDWQRFFKARQKERTDAMCIGVLTAFFAFFQVLPDEFPRLQEVFSPRLSNLPPRSEVTALFQPRRFALKNKLWASKLQASSASGYFWWWAFSLPARLVVHQPSPKIGKQKGSRHSPHNSP